MQRGFIIARRTDCVQRVAVTGLVLISLLALAAPVQALDLPWFGKKFPTEPSAAPAPDILIPPPGEEQFFPVRADGQPYLLNVDTTVNFTDALNRFYYNPKWRGEIWTPFPSYDVVERTSRLMSTWPEFDQMNQYHLGNHVSKFLERYSGYGP